MSATAPTVPPIVSAPRRLIALEAAHNVRDLGGYVLGDGRTIAWGRLLRGDGLHHLTSADLTALAPVGLRTVLDLRTAAEIAERGAFPVANVPAGHPTIAMVHLPVIDSTWQHQDVPQFDAHDEPEVEFLTWAYRSMLVEGGRRFGEAVRLLARPDALPAIFHCAAGKDRTGILAALVLAALGVDDDVIVGDYGLTAAGMARMRAWYQLHHPERAEIFAETPSAFFAARPEAMQRTLDELRASHGSVADYLSTIGVDAGTLRSLADRLTD